MAEALLSIRHKDSEFALRVYLHEVFDFVWFQWVYTIFNLRRSFET